MIYAELLIVGKVFPYTFSETISEYDLGVESDDDETIETMMDCSGCAAPFVDLLTVCKAIHKDAEPILYQRNILVLPASDLTPRFFKCSLHNDIRRSWIKSGELISDDTSDMNRHERVRLGQRVEKSQGAPTLSRQGH